MDAPTDLHASKSSHMSLPVASGLEFHLKHNEVGCEDCQVGHKHTIEVPAIVTSREGDATRFLQQGAIRVGPEHEEMTKEAAEKMPLDQLKKKIGTVKPGEEYK